MNLIKPHRLEKGQTIGLVAPASPTNEPEGVRFAIEVVESLGFRVKPGPHLFDRNGYFAGQDRDRADDINRMFADNEVAAVIAVRGGYGSSRLLPYLDYDLIGNNPKAFIGYSDITALLHAIHLKTGLVTFHGPIAATTFTPYTLAEFKKVLMFPQDKTQLGAPPEFEASAGNVERKNRLTPFVSGCVRGPLIGGNLTLMTHLLGTPYEPDFNGKLLILEDIDEYNYRLNRMLTQLWLAGKFEAVAGVVFGKFTRCGPQLSVDQQLFAGGSASRTLPGSRHSDPARSNDRPR